MASLFGSANPAALPMNVLFPEAYKRSARTTARDLALFAIMITVSIVGLAAVM